MIISYVLWKDTKSLKTVKKPLPTYLTDAKGHILNKINHTAFGCNFMVCFDLHYQKFRKCSLS